MQNLSKILFEEELWLLPAKAIYWVRLKTLFIADLHIGKCAAFRKAGIPVSIASTEYDLMSLTKLIQATHAERLIILGDFFHSSAAQNNEITRLLENWRNQFLTLQIDLIKGNHDKHAGEPASSLNICSIAEYLYEPPFLLTHDVIIKENCYTLAGHVHPVINLYGPGQDKLRLPCFYFAEDYGLLPSFGYFTGGYAINDKIKAAEVYAIAEDEIVKIY